MEMGLENKVVLITGGSSGIGAAAAELFAKEGAKVVIVSRTMEKLVEVAERVQANCGAEVTPLACDIRNEREIEQALRQVAELFGGIDVVINNAGAALPKPYEEMSDEDWHDALGYKLLGYVHTAVKALPYLRLRGGGRIINVTGTAGREPNPWTTSTGITNAGLSNFTKTLASQVAKDNILVNAVSPGPIDTGRWVNIANQRKGAAQGVIDLVPLGRLGRPEEAAAAIVFLASAQATFITGASLTVDGGRCASIVF